jgi:hypothetical protein
MWEDIKMDLREIRRDGYGLIWLRIGTSRGLTNTVMNLRVP